MAEQAWDWPWSSARIHIGAGAEALLRHDWAEYFGGWNPAGWRQTLAARLAAEDEDTVRRATRTGEPMGSRRFLAELEHRTGKRLRVGPRGRPKSKALQSDDLAATQGNLFAPFGV
jgi:hypothetical protein